MVSTTDGMGHLSRSFVSSYACRRLGSTGGVCLLPLEDTWCLVLVLFFPSPRDFNLFAMHPDLTGRHFVDVTSALGFVSDEECRTLVLPTMSHGSSL